jgi:membrane-associated protease RseP (regulator of RpoE activity)
VTAGTSGDAGVPPSSDFAVRPAWVPERPKFQNRTWLHVLLLLLTVVTTTLVGALHYAGFLLDFQERPLPLTFTELLPYGFWYSGTILAILGAHELGHYLACRYYRVDASLPYFLPAPLPLTGTLGAFIRIREPIPTKLILFDIGAAGPFAGFLVAVPALVVGVALSRMVPLPADLAGTLELGEPLLFQWISQLVWGPTPDGYSLNLHPIAFAAWFGLLATALNLIPIGQLDGGHIAYAVLGRRSSILTLGAVLAAVGLTFVSRSWVVWTTLMVVMLFLYGPHHPRTYDEDVPLDHQRLILALLAAVILIVCFTPSPISEPMELIRTR